jgi:hypothetical protein
MQFRILLIDKHAKFMEERVNNARPKIYCLGGLILEKNIFKDLSPSGVELVYIPYEEPKKGESIVAYSKRLFNHVRLPDCYQLLGVSFGGIIATEFAKIRKPEKLFLVSSISRIKQIPFKLRLAGYLYENKLIPERLLKSKRALSKYVFGIKGKEELERIKQFSNSRDLAFIKWAFTAILNWKNTEIPEAIRIHGTKDKILPYDGKAEYPIWNGSHFIIRNRSNEISQILATINGFNGAI